ncbi:hypothetical protein EVA_11435 [gut metagenome]|uniref:Uncharacterized protein n=1 Tax=gut metagenome TaxID=749906 RepID=J9GL53_9ZZZZ
MLLCNLPQHHLLTHLPPVFHRLPADFLHPGLQSQYKQFQDLTLLLVFLWQERFLSPILPHVS